MTVEEMLTELSNLAIKISCRTQYRASVFIYSKSERFEVKVYANAEKTSRIINYWINKEKYEDLHKVFEKHRDKLLNFLEEGR
jgi:hypothetical protein